MYKWIFYICSVMVLASCVVNNQYNIDYDKFKQHLSICKKFKRDYETVAYVLCYMNDITKNNERYGIAGYYQMNSPVPVNFNEAILYNGKKLKMSSEDDRRLGITINTFMIQVDADVLDNVQDRLEIKMYGDKGITYLIDLITKDDIINFKDVITKEKQSIFNNTK